MITRHLIVDFLMRQRQMRALKSCELVSQRGVVGQLTFERFDAEATYRVALFQAPDQNPWGQS